MPDSQAGAGYFDDLDPMQSNRVGTVWRARAENPLQLSAPIATRVHRQYIAPRAVQPCYYNDLVTCPYSFEGIYYPQIEYQPSLRRSLVRLVRSILGICQRGLDTADRMDFNRHSAGK